MRFLRFWLAILGTVVLLQACSGGKQDGSSKDFDEPELPEVTVDVRRTDLAMQKAAHALQTKPAKNLTGALAWYKQYLQQDRDFLSVLRFDRPDAPDSVLADQYLAFLMNPYVRDLLDSVALQYPDTVNLAADFELPLRRFKAYFPDQPVPAIRTYITGYQQPGLQTMDPYLVSENYLGLGLHYALGQEFTYYPPDIPVYVRRRLDRKHLVAGLLRSNLRRFRPMIKRTAPPELLETMIDEGIVLYALDRLLPTTPDSVKIEYAAEQMKFAELYLKNIWNEILPELYSTDALKYRRLLDDGPYTKGMAMESPPRLGAYVGWQIVRAYMKRNPKVTPAELLRATDYKVILEGSKFRP